MSGADALINRLHHHVTVATAVFVCLIVPFFIAMRLQEGLSLQRTVAVQQAKIQELEQQYAQTKEQLDSLMREHGRIAAKDSAPPDSELRDRIQRLERWRSQDCQ